MTTPTLRLAVFPADTAPLLAQATQPVKAGRAGKPESSRTSNQLAEHPTR